MFLPAYVSVPLCFRPPASLSVCVYVRLYPCLSASLPVCTPSVCTLNTVAHRALFHRSLSTYSVLFVLLACPVLSFFLLIFSFLFFLFFSSFFSSFFSFTFTFSFTFSFSFSFSFSSSLIFSLPILLTLLALPATHHFLSKNLYREHTLRNCDVPHAATHPFELKTLYRERGELRRP